MDLDKSDAGHARSLVPERVMVRDIEHVRWVGCLNPNEVTGTLPIANPVNQHEYKPSYVRQGDELVCYVAGPDVRDQVQHAWKRLDYGQLNTVADDSPAALTQLRNAVSDGLAKLRSKPATVLYARLDSFIIVKHTLELIARRAATVDDVASVLASFESKRLAARFRLDPPDTTGVEELVSDGFVRMALVRDLDLLVVNLPWGEAVSRALAETVGPLGSCTLVVGGAGACSFGLDVESVFCAREVVAEGVQFRSISNVLADSARRLGIDVSEGRLESIPRSMLAPSDPEADVVETESAFMLPSFGADCTVGVMHYVMDNARAGLPLSRTYYNQAWLSSLVRQRQRGKYLCYAAVLEHCGVDGKELLRT
ncbi:hypothetical protein [Micromonospora fulviviridis]|uniref:hypothetical protein n=1 Tax=Micromonospora fulviviridis TaxID=47860 RepID=UPI0037B25D88